MSHLLPAMTIQRQATQEEDMILREDIRQEVRRVDMILVNHLVVGAETTE